jgi:glycosyltransferase involved in cell wall biosynthesis
MKVVSGERFLHYLEVEANMKPKIAVVTAGHLATCPRMLKAADALVDEGYPVEVISTRSTDWAAEGDRDIERRRADRPRHWQANVIDYSRKSGRGTYLRTGVRRRVARLLADRVPNPGFGLAARAFARVHDEIVARALASDADFFYGGTTGAIAAVFEAATRSRRPYALDLEDFFTGEPPDGSLDQRLAERIEREILPEARFLTASNEAIAEAYRVKYGVRPVTVHNTFTLPDEPPELGSRREGPLRLYWFSQTIGPGRGLEEAVVACGLAGGEIELHLRGATAPDFEEVLSSLVRDRAPRLALALRPPGSPDEMTRLSRDCDAGLSLEQPVSANRLLCLTNKALTYLLSGLALVFTDTPGHRLLIEDLDGDAVVVPTRDSSALASGLDRLARDRGFLDRCRRRSWEAARRRWHWEHPEERGRLVALFASI